MGISEKRFIIKHGRRLALPGKSAQMPVEGQPMQGKSTPRRSREAIRPISASIAYLPVQNGAFTLIDIEDADWLSRYAWIARGRDRKYVYCQKYGTVDGKIYRPSIHRLLVSPPRDVFVDHINGNSMDNRRSNLRLATCMQSNQNRRATRLNTSGYKGVHWHKYDKRWQAKIGANGRYIFLGNFTNPAEAHAAYCAAAKELHGEYARP